MILSGDCVEVMRGMDDESVDAIVTDPPYGLGFMGKAWDDLPPGLEWARECLRVLKPGGHLLAFGGSRTYHRLAVAVEDAGFEVRDQMMWLYGSGFPKSLDVSKAIDKKRGVDTADDARWVATPHFITGANKTATGKSEKVGQLTSGVRHLYDPDSTDAKKWSGWGTALKPAHEPIVVARKPLVGTVAENVLRFGTGALNIDGCRIAGNISEMQGRTGTSKIPGGLFRSYRAHNPSGGIWEPTPAGRWPANLILDEEAGRLLDEQSGEGVSRVGKPRSGQAGEGWAMTATGAEYEDAGGASRFFYCAKAGKAERNAGLDEFEDKRPDDRTATGMGSFEEKGVQPQRNHHPTVKPISLMAYLVRLVTPPNGTVLDPFLGSGTTGCAAVLEGFDFIGIEREADYIAIAEARIAWWEKHKGNAEVSDILSAGKDRDEVEDAGQLDLLDQAA